MTVIRGRAAVHLRPARRTQLSRLAAGAVFLILTALGDHVPGPLRLAVAIILAIVIAYAVLAALQQQHHRTGFRYSHPESSYISLIDATQLSQISGKARVAGSRADRKRTLVPRRHNSQPVRQHSVAFFGSPIVVSFVLAPGDDSDLRGNNWLRQPLREISLRMAFSGSAAIFRHPVLDTPAYDYLDLPMSAYVILGT